MPSQSDGARRAEADAASAGSALDSEALERLIVRALDDDKAQDITVIGLADKSSVADAMIIASGRSQRHVGAISDHLLRRLKDAGAKGVRVEGLPACDWVLLDAGDVIVHVFRPEVRAFYNLEKIWGAEAPADSASA
ncbi:MAG: ribosome silencing factor [Caulobacterales bacterium]|nr:ribosome silencing factor [Caulobacterales bacterium]